MQARQVKVKAGWVEYFAILFALAVLGAFILSIVRPDLWQAWTTPRVIVQPVVPTAQVAPQPVVQPQPMIAPVADPTDVAASQQTDGDEGQEHTKPNTHPLPPRDAQEVQSVPARVDDSANEGTKPARHRLP